MCKFKRPRVSINKVPTQFLLGQERPLRSSRLSGSPVGCSLCEVVGDRFQNPVAGNVGDSEGRVSKKVVEEKVGVLADDTVGIIERDKVGLVGGDFVGDSFRILLGPVKGVEL